jgi:hypothetical protein
MAVGFVGLVGTASAASLACTVTDTSNPHFFNAASSAGVTTSEGQTGGGVTVVFSANNPPCDQVGSDGDNEQGLAGAQMPFVGATCPYSQDVANEQAGGGPVTIGHHSNDIYVTNAFGIDVTWSSGVDGQDPAASAAGLTCTGNGVISDDATTDPADCSDSRGANINILGSVHEDTDPLGDAPGGEDGTEPGVTTNDPASGFTCFDAVDGNEWTFLNVGPFATILGDGRLLTVELSPSPATCTAQDNCDSESFVTVDAGGATCVDTSDFGSDNDVPTTCLITIDPDVCFFGPTSEPDCPSPLTGFPPTVGFSLPITGTIASGVEM